MHFHIGKVKKGKVRQVTLPEEIDFIKKLHKI